MYGWTYDITYQWFKMDLRSIQREIILYSSLFCSIITSKVYQCFIIPIKQPFKPLKIHIREVHTFQDCQQNFFWDLECNNGAFCKFFYVLSVKYVIHAWVVQGLCHWLFHWYLFIGRDCLISFSRFTLLYNRSKFIWNILTYLKTAICGVR